jgi:hypothetical protein
VFSISMQKALQKEVGMLTSLNRPKLMPTDVVSKHVLFPHFNMCYVCRRRCRRRWAC